MRRFNSRSEILKMIRRYVDGTATPAEVSFLDKYYELLDDGPDSIVSLSESDRRTIEDELAQVLANDEPESYSFFGKRRLHLRRLSIAALFLIMCATAFYFYSRPGEPARPQVAKKTLIRTDAVVPGRNTAVLTLADGRRINLDSLKNGDVIEQAGLTITKVDDQLVYSRQTISDEEERNLVNVIETPRGGEYMVVLPDGTRVWLNAASSLRYPARFNLNERRVDLLGEAYFEVARDPSRPFRVKSPLQLIEVLGTHFNVNAYSDEREDKTTLIEGSVKVYPHETDVFRTLRPGHQASVKLRDTDVQISSVNAGEAVAWKNGYFLFNNEPIESVMRKISRWYDVDIEYEGKMPVSGFGGVVSKSKNISEVLRILELTREVHFKVRGRRVTVMS